LMIRMIPPAPGDQNVDVEKVVHGAQGKSDSISRVESTVSGGKSSGASKIVAPVNGHDNLWTGAGRREGPTACLRRNSDTVRRSLFARARICRASSSLTLKEMVAIVLPYYRRSRVSKFRGRPFLKIPTLFQTSQETDSFHPGPGISETPLGLATGTDFLVCISIFPRLRLPAGITWR
jgi:hypothetical protein